MPKFSPINKRSNYWFVLSAVVFIAISAAIAVNWPGPALVRAATTDTIELFSYGSTGYRYSVIDSSATPPSNYQLPAFDDSAWPVGTAAFGFSQGLCSIQNRDNTLWPSNTQLLVRKVVNVPANAANIRVLLALDNDIQEIFFDGRLIAGPQTHDNCPNLDDFSFTVPDSLATAGDHTVVYRVSDRGQETFFDTRILADIGPPANQPPVAGFTMTGGFQSAIEGQTLNVTAPTAPVFVNFTADRSFDGDGTITAWEWKIDGNVVSNGNSVPYGLNFGSHIVSLVVTDNLGATSSQVNGTIEIAGSGSTTPIILIPGIGGSTLEVPGSQFKGWPCDYTGWPCDVAKSSIGDPQNLEFDEFGNPRTDTPSASLEANGVFTKGYKLKTLEDYLVQNGYSPNITLYEFPYDFRRSVKETADVLRDFIVNVHARTGAARVNIIAHSMGGLIAKKYLDNSSNAINVESVIMLGTPNLGAPKALKFIRYGDDFGKWNLDACKVKRAAHNMPGVYNLLPGRRYFELEGGYFFDEADIDGNGVTGRLDFDQMIYNLKRGFDGRICSLNENYDSAPFYHLSEFLVDQEDVSFHDYLDNWSKPFGVRVFAIAGYGVSTLILIREANETKLDKRYVPTCTTKGDETVPLTSAANVDADAVYYADFSNLKTNHGDMVADVQIRTQVLNLIRNGAGVYGAYITTTRPTSFRAVPCS